MTVDEESGRVIGLELPGVSLDNDSGGFFGGHNRLDMLGDLTALTHLDLSGNNLGGALPPELDQLTALTHLNLSGNMFRGDIEEQNPGHDRGIDWENLQNLVELDLSWNKRDRGCTLICRHGLSGSIPEALNDLPNLAVLNLSGNELTSGAKFLLDNGFAENAEATIAVDLRNNPWSEEEPADTRNYWNEFQADMLRGFVDLSVLAYDQFSNYPQLRSDSIRKYAEKEGLEKIEIRAVQHLAINGRYRHAAKWVIRGVKVAGGASNVIGWALFAGEGIEIASRMLEAGILFLENGPGQVIRSAQNKYLGARDSCLIENNLHLVDPFSEAAFRACGPPD